MERRSHFCGFFRAPVPNAWVEVYPFRERAYWQLPATCAAVTAGAFRQDLFYRLNVSNQAPSLRDLQEDILLVEYLIGYGKRRARRSKDNEGHLTLSKPTIGPEMSVNQNVVSGPLSCVMEKPSPWTKLGFSENRRSPLVQLFHWSPSLWNGRRKHSTTVAECEGRISGPSGAATKLGIPRQTLEWKIAKLRTYRYRFKPVGHSA
jgi:formate hydrogenlyase transcriptional activator